MNGMCTRIAAAMMLVMLLATAALGQSQELRLKDGSRWTGQAGDPVSIVFTEQGVERSLNGTIEKIDELYLVVQAKIAGKSARKLIYLNDVKSLETVTSSTGAAEIKEAASSSATTAPPEQPEQDAWGNLPKLFVLPLEGGVGDSFRHEEIAKIGEHADQFGPGQIIVLIINSNGGLVVESNKINDEIFDLKKRHRVVAWIQKAISAGCSTAMACDEIYFMTDGTAGSVTTVSGSGSLPEEMVVEHIEALVETAKRSGYSEHIARCMKLNKYMCSYDKDPVTGEVTFYGDLSGEFILSDAKSNLTFNSSNALHCGFSKGTADTTEELAKLLDLPYWKEHDDYGREIAKARQDLVERGTTEIRRLLTRIQYAGAGGSQEERLGRLIQIFTELGRWYNRDPLLAMMNIPYSPDQIERTIEELRRDLARMKR